jgi:YHS domain-containing protein
MKPADTASPAPAEKAIRAKDPVCGMDIEITKDAPETQYKGKTYHFCSKLCKKSFDGSPAKYVHEPKAEKDMRMAGMAK